MSKPTQISVGLGTTMGIVTIVASVLVSYFASNAATTDRVALVAQDVAVLKEARTNTEDTLKDLSSKTDRIPYIEGKIDAALGRLQINPQTVEASVFRQVLKENAIASSSEDKNNR